MNLIIGGSGFLGINLAKTLINKGEKVRIFDINKQSNLENIDFFQGSVESIEDIDAAMKNCDIVYNLVSLLPCSRAGKNFKNINATGTTNILKVALANKIRKVVHISSSIVYGLPSVVPLKEDSPTVPIGQYGQSKLLAEKTCFEYSKKGLDITIIRPRFIVGPGRLGLLTVLFDWIESGKNIYTIGSGNNIFQMIDVRDLVDACILSSGKKGWGIYNIGADNPPSVKNMLNSLVCHAGTKSKVIAINSFLSKILLSIFNKLGISPFGKEHYLIADKDYILDTNTAKSALRWYPKINQPDSLNSSYDYYIKNRNIIPKDTESNFPKEKILKILKMFS